MAAREEVDRRVKTLVLEGAWRLAAQRAFGDVNAAEIVESVGISNTDGMNGNFVNINLQAEVESETKAAAPSSSTTDVRSDEVATRLLEEYRRKTAASAARRPSLPDDGRGDDAGGVKAVGEPSCDPSRVVQTGDSDWIELGSGYGDAQV